MLLILPLKSHAALQSNPSTHYGASYKKTPVQWMSQIRQMEAANNAMGLTEVFNSDLTTKDGTESNNIDVHMMRNTEYGAIAILAVSGYGNPTTMQASGVKSTTGNVTGVYYTTAGYNDSIHYEFVAGGLSGRIFSGTNTRYYDAYSATKGAVKVGDAMNMKWQGAPDPYWLTSSHPYFVRNSNGYFGFFGSIEERHLLRSWSSCVWSWTLKGCEKE